MADPPTSGTPSSDNGAAIVSEQLTALLLKDEDTNNNVRSSVASTSPSHLEASHFRDHGENAAPPNRRQLFSSVREALESSGQLKEESGGYVIKRHSGRQQQQQHCRSAEKPKNRHAKQRSDSKGDTILTSTSNPVEDEADAAGYTVIRRRLSCDESISASVAATATITGRRNYQSSTPARGNKKTQQQSQRPRRGSMSVLSQRSNLQASMKPPPSFSVPPGFQPYSTSRVLHPPPGLTPAASGWVVKAAAPAQNVKKIEEPPVEALWPEMKPISKSDSGWTVTRTTATSVIGGESDLNTQAWTTTTSSSTVADQNDDDDDDLLTRLGVTL
ncbi:unnamed protein product [Peronospora belbahrii]|uniref:Uncharacterized protein n=1 Tax=Peronospora belbahrii TaxID=622444 RepID=A0AAU9KMM5_9STRA|nr:unnamed protein product [Peronospora belbahrii]CAH0515502.1 unnamed protein product [Peronospora belbahrii]